MANIFHMERNREDLWRLAAMLVKRFRTTVRFGMRSISTPSEWSTWIAFPSASYVEISNLGPVLKNDVKWIGINLMEIQRVGRLIPPRNIDHSAEIRATLKREGVVFEVVGEEARLLL